MHIKVILLITELKEGTYQWGGLMKFLKAIFIFSLSFSFSSASSAQSSSLITAVWPWIHFRAQPLSKSNNRPENGITNGLVIDGSGKHCVCLLVQKWDCMGEMWNELCSLESYKIFRNVTWRQRLALANLSF